MVDDGGEGKSINLTENAYILYLSEIPAFA